MSTPTPPKRALKLLIGSRSIRGYILEKREYLTLHPEATEYHETLIEAIEMLLEASEPGRVAL